MLKGFRYFIHRWVHWEYWPDWLVFVPIVPYYLYLSAKARSLFFFSSSNPTMEYGGMAGESKMDVYDLIPSEYLPKTILCKKDESLSKIKAFLIEEKINYPIFVKPDKGGKGMGVEIINKWEELEKYAQEMPLDIICQEKIDFPNEVGIFYIKYPNSEHGIISGMVGKKAVKVVGDGQNTLEALILNNPRFYFQKEYLFKKFNHLLENVIPRTEEVMLSTIGNHARGSEFVDLTSMVDEKLEQQIDSISNKIPQFYFGRYDIKYNSLEELSEGKNFKIIELNGAGSAPTHIYDPNFSLLNAWKVLTRHWKYLYDISIMNQQRGIGFMSFKDGMRMIKINNQVIELLEDYQRKSWKSE